MTAGQDRGAGCAGDQGSGHQGAGHQVYGRPTLGELVGAVREALADATAPGGPPLSGFRARVAANALAMAERELARGEADQRAYAAALARLGAAGEADLAAEIRAGHRDHELGEIAREFRAIVAARLAVAHPGYDTPGGDGHAAPALCTCYAETGGGAARGMRHRPSCHRRPTVSCRGAPNRYRSSR